MRHILVIKSSLPNVYNTISSEILSMTSGQQFDLDRKIVLLVFLLGKTSRKGCSKTVRIFTGTVLQRY